MTPLRVGTKFKKTRRNSFECKVCSQVCLSAQEFRVHFQTHGGGRPYKCDKCCQTFKSKDSHQRHLFKHEGKKPFLCDICGKGFCTNQTLKEHTAIHNNKMLYSCSMCDRAFRHHSGLSRHLLVHQNQAVHMCHICGQLFLNSAYLSSHMRSHSGERCFTCKICFHQFKHASSLSRHCALHHKEPNINKSDVCTLCPSADSLLKHKKRVHSEPNNSQTSEIIKLKKNKLSSFFKRVGLKNKSQDLNLESVHIGHCKSKHQNEVNSSESVHNINCDQVSLDRIFQFAQRCQSMPTPVSIHIFKKVTLTMKQLADILADSDNISNSDFQKYLSVLNSLQEVVSKNLSIKGDQISDKDYR